MIKIIFKISILLLTSALGLASLTNYNSNLGLQPRDDLQKEFSQLLQWEGTQESTTSSWYLEKLSKFQVQIQNVFKTVPKRSIFASRQKDQMEAMLSLRNIIMAQGSLEDTLKIAGALRDHPQMNPKLWLKSLISAKFVRSDMEFLRFPTSLVELMPDDFIPRELFEIAKNENVELRPKADICLVVDDRFTSDNGNENALWYFREDMMANAHHFLWHVFYATNGEVRPDRRGELFSFMHHEILARYATERISHGLPVIAPIRLDYVTPMETYYSHLSDRNSQSNYTDRAPNSTLKDLALYFEPFQFWLNRSVADGANLKDLISQDIQAGHLIYPNGSAIELDGFTGTDLLGETIESSIWSVNPDRYNDGGIHNNGHDLISIVMSPISPNASFGVNVIPGVMVNPSTSMRDPIFYRWHTLVENFFLDHKNLLEPYTPDETNYPLRWASAQITEFKVVPEGGQAPENELKTFWAQKQLNFSRGLDWGRNASSSDPILICPKHLDHTEFDYQINVENSSSANETKATVRIYMARREDANSNRFSMEEQRGLFFTLDQFSVTLTPGTNRIIRNSRNSSLTIPFESWTDLRDEDIVSHNCGCGWPHHLLLPKGSASGTIYDIFVMITEGHEESEPEGENTCRIAPMWCGIRGKKYPSRFPLGYPFDRRPYSVDGQVVANLDEYVQGIPNMNTVQVRIQHLEN